MSLSRKEEEASDLKTCECSTIDSVPSQELTCTFTPPAVVASPENLKVFKA
jgi:hypothetical protein